MTSIAAAAEEDASSKLKARKRHTTGQTTGTVKSTPQTSTSTGAGSTSNSSRLRQSIVQHTKKEKLEHLRIARMSAQSQNSVQKMYLALIMNILLVAMGTLIYFDPEFFFERIAHSGNNRNNPKREWPPHHLALLYPPNISPAHDLPRFFDQYSIATTENQGARDALRRLMTVQARLRPFKIQVKAWERENLLKFSSIDDYCGKGFQQTYEGAVQNRSLRHAEDLLLWCLLQTYQNDGFIAHWNVTVQRAPISAARGVQYTEEDTLKGIIPKHVLHNRMHPSFLWLPKKRERQPLDTNNESNNDSNNKGTKLVFDMDSQVPAKMLFWLIQKAATLNVWQYGQAMEEHLYELIMEEKDRWMMLDVVCDDPSMDGDDPKTNKKLFENRRVMAHDCRVPSSATLLSPSSSLESTTQQPSSCCTVFLPPEAASNRTRRLRISSDSKD